jgi:hypothetical protein
MSEISFQQKEGSSKKMRREQGLKSKRGEISYEELHVQKKRGYNLQPAGRDSIKRKKKRRSHFPIVQNLMCGIIHTHTSFVLHYLLFLDFSLSYPHSLHHSPSIMIICHTNSLEFFSFTIYKV